MFKNFILLTIHHILWAVYWRVAIRVGTRDPDYPDFAWTNTRPRMQKMSDWILNLNPHFK